MGRRRHRVEDGPRVSGYIASASPTRPPTSHLYVFNGDKLYSEGFTQDEYAAAFLAAILEGETGQTWRKNAVGLVEIVCDSGLRVRASTTNELERLIETSSDVELPEWMERQIAAIKSNEKPAVKNNAGETIEPTAPVEKKPREKVERTPKPAKPDGYKGVPELAAALNLDGADVRVLLRKNVPKPGIGWLWSDADFAAVLKQLKSVK